MSRTATSHPSHVIPWLLCNFPHTDLKCSSYSPNHLSYQMLYWTALNNFLSLVVTHCVNGTQTIFNKCTIIVRLDSTTVLVPETLTVTQALYSRLTPLNILNDNMLQTQSVGWHLRYPWVSNPLYRSLGPIMLSFWLGFNNVDPILELQGHKSVKWWTSLWSYRKRNRGPSSRKHSLS